MHPRRTSGACRSLPIVVALTLSILQLGCDAFPLGPQDNASRRPLLNSREMPPVQDPVIEGQEDNNEFELAQPATLPVDGQFVVEGRIDQAGDVDIYALGPALAGDLVVVDVTGHDGLNTVAALFDGQANLIDANNDRSFYAGQLNPYMSQVVQQDTEMLYVGVAVSTAVHFASSAGQFDTGSYTIRLSRRLNAAVRPARPQLVWLDFEGSDFVQIALEPIVQMRPFSAESISGRFAGQTDYLIEVVLSHLRLDLAQFNVLLLDSRHDVEPTEPHTKLYFGNYNESYLGLADSVDTGNVYQDQEAIIYAEDLQLFEGLFPTIEQTGQALANIAAHELGHLLGLEHSFEAADVMATAGSARQILEINSDYRRSRVQPDVFPAGWQDGWSILMQNVGPNPSAGARSRLPDWLPADNAGAVIDDSRPDIAIHMCGRCAGEAQTTPH